MISSDTSAAGTPLELLLVMEQSAITDEPAVENESTGIDEQRVLSFTVQELKFIVNVVDILHITACERLYSLPQTKKWLRGVTSQKGVIYSVTDLHLFAGHNKGVDIQKAHLVLLNRPVEQVALLVNHVSGFRHLNEGRQGKVETKHEALLGELQQYAQALYEFDGDEYFQLNFDALMHSNRFLEVQ